jgi:NifB/MoaA-like Fe-S oxidoreductase
MDQPASEALLRHVDRWAERGNEERGTPWVFGSDELYLLAARELPDAEYYVDFPQIENGVGSVAALRQRLQEGLAEVPRLEGRRIGVVTGVSMSNIMPELLGALHEQTGADFELIVTTNSLFGPTTTTAGLLVASDIRRALAGRNDLDLALIPAECINDSGVFLDDESFIALREQLPMPVYPSYDFIDVLSEAPSRRVAESPR